MTATSPQIPLQGTLHVPGSPGWDDARRPWNLAIDQHPAAVVYAESAADVAATVRFARDRGTRVALQGTGHAASALGPLEGAILVKTERMRGLTIDPRTRIARAEAGVLAGAVAAAAGEHGLAPLSGSSPDVGVVGYTLGGGIGWLGRRHGLASNSVTAIDVVTADGEQARIDHDNDTDLFWALRGGGGAFAAVTAIEFRLAAVEAVFAGSVAYPAARAAEVIDRYRVWTESAPDSVTTSIRFLRLPDFPSVPEPLRDNPVIGIDIAYLGSERDGGELVRPLRGSGALIDRFATMPAADLIRLHGDPEQPVPGIGDHLMLNELTMDAAEAFEAVGGIDSGSPLLALELRQLGGAFGTAPEGHGALARLDGDYALYGTGAPGPAVAEHLARVIERMDEFSTGRTYLNYDDARPQESSARSFDAETYARLRSVKARYDSGDLFLSNHPVAPSQ